MLDRNVDKESPLSPTHFDADYPTKWKTFDVNARALDIRGVHENTGLRFLSADVLQKNLHVRAATRFSDKSRVALTSSQ